MDDTPHVNLEPIMNIFTRAMPVLPIRKLAIAIPLVAMVSASMFFGTVSASLAVACIEVTVFFASLALSFYAATRVGDLYGDTLARSSWPGKQPHR